MARFAWALALKWRFMRCRMHVSRAVGLLLFLASPLLYAAKPAPAEVALARELWEQAVAAQEREDWAACEKALTEAVAIVETPGLRFHLAHCREMQTKWVEALVDYELVGEMLEAGSKADDVAELLPPALERLESKIPKLTVLVEPMPQQANLFIDGIQLSAAVLGKALPLNPGSHIVELTAPGFEPISRRISLLDSENRELSLRFVNLRDLPPRDLDVLSTSHERELDSTSAKPYVMAAQALIALGASSVAGYHLVEANHAQELWDASASTLTRCETVTSSLDCSSAEREQLEYETDAYDEQRKHHETAAWIWGIAGGVAATTLVVTWVLWPEHEGYARWHVAPLATGGGTVGLTAVF